MEVNHKCEGSNLCVSLIGELGHHEAIMVMKRIGEITDLHVPCTMVLDLSGVSFMDSSGIAVVVRASQACRDIGASFCVKSVPRQARRVLDAAGLGRIIQFV